ncbi:hypothetical protein C7S18_22530 [Ahniella affigens]|uniref:asparagine synthase (glutamine-hydrolyzing) n=1 Tax=Ahniella affigens TaxID=2021234 RepID=A0A2P1PY58_9GAMM|nr:asparagine synthase C-terminal domain-containing protein [Ahniella affigens]AVP99779.1 hypothetical protein C7S18_22530 [Ahniella affigens]
MSAFLLLCLPPSDARADAVRRARLWWHAYGQRPGGPADRNPCRQYEYPEAALLVWSGHASWLHEVDAKRVRMRVSSQPLAADNGQTSAHALELTRDEAGAWTLGRGWHAERNVYFQGQAGRFAAGSSPRLLLAGLGLPIAENPDAVAAFFAHRPLGPPACFFQGVQCLRPGTRLSADPTGAFRISEPAPINVEPIAARTDRDWLQALDQALRRALGDEHRPGSLGLMLSGGIDSSSLAAGLAATRQRAQLFTWQLPLARSDESAFAAKTAAALGLPLTVVPAHTTPFANLDTLPINPDAPLANPYRALNDALMQAATDSGVTTLLSGNFGDHLYPEPQLAWTSAWRGSRYGLAASAGWHKLSRRLRAGPWWPRSWQSQPLESSPLTPFAAELLTPLPPIDVPDWPIEDHSRLVDIFAAAPRLDAEGAWYFGSAYPLELRFPYRHQALLDLALQWPVHVSERHGQRKWLTRRWLNQKLPDAIRLRPKSGSLAPWFWHGLAVHRDAVLARLNQPNARWSRYLQPETVLASIDRAGSEAAGLHVWQALCYEIWHETAIRDGTLR